MKTSFADLSPEVDRIIDPKVGENTQIIEEQRSLETIEDYEELRQRTNLAEELQTNAGPSDSFDKDVFRDKEKGLRVDLMKSKTDKDKEKVNESIRILKDLERDVRAVDSFKGVVDPLKKREKDIEDTFLKKRTVNIRDAAELKKYKEKVNKNETWKASDAKKTNVIYHEAHWNREGKQEAMKDLEKTKTAYDALITAGENDLANQLLTGNYRKKILNTYETLKKDYGYAEKNRQKANLERSEKFAKLIDPSLTPSEKNKLEKEIETLGVEVTALTRIIQEQEEILYKKLGGEHKLNEHLEEAETVENTPQTNLTENQKNWVKWIARGAGLVVGFSTSTGLSSLGPMGWVCAASLTAIVGGSTMMSARSQNTGGEIPFISNWLGASESSITTLREQINVQTDPTIKAQMERTLSSRLKRQEMISESIRPFWQGASVGLFIGTGLGLHNTGVNITGTLMESIANPTTADRIVAGGAGIAIIWGYLDWLKKKREAERAAATTTPTTPPTSSP